MSGPPVGRHAPPCQEAGAVYRAFCGTVYNRDMS